MTPDPISHSEELKIFSKMLNSKAAAIAMTVVVTGMMTWLMTGATYASDLNAVKRQMEEKSEVDSLRFKDVLDKNAKLIEALETSNAAIINLNTSIERMQVQIEYMQNDLDYVRRKLDKNN